jgi:hypothetical protein
VILCVLSVLCFVAVGFHLQFVAQISPTLAFVTVLTVVVLLAVGVFGSIMRVSVRRKRTSRAIAEDCPEGIVLDSYWTPLHDWPFREGTRNRGVLNPRGSGVLLVVDDDGIGVWRTAGNGHPWGTVPWAQIRGIRVSAEAAPIGSKPRRVLSIDIDSAGTPFAPNLEFAAPPTEQVDRLVVVARRHGIQLGE